MVWATVGSWHLGIFLLAFFIITSFSLVIGAYLSEKDNESDKHGRNG
jgi:hypothetical protein